MDKKLYNYYLVKRAHRKNRQKWDINLAEEYSRLNFCAEERVVDRFCRLCALERPIIQEFEKIAMVRTVANIPDCFTAEEWADIRKEKYVHELGYVSNLTPNYAKTIAEGLLARREGATDAQKRSIDALLGLCDRYRAEAERMGRDDLVKIFERVPRYGARNFREALQFFRILHYALWLEGNYHNTVGRFDVYMYPYFKADMDAGVYTKEEALDLIEDFFISFNKDSDLYVGVQQGDNGQSIVLGGIDENGTDCFSELSELCITASRNLKLIDPKINLRVSKNTPIEIYEKGTELTQVGLGFPQYSNDDVVIPALIKMGYEPKDAVNYTVAACWEYIIPGVGDDIANIGAVNFPRIVDEAIRDYLPCGNDFDGLMDRVRKGVYEECNRITSSIGEVWFAPSPFVELLRDEKKYHNFGLHGCGIASAADALAAVKQYVFDEKCVAADRLISAIDNDFATDPELLHKLRFEAPKMGKDDDRADLLARDILNIFADALEGKKNYYGGIWRAGTGTAMYYLWYARELGATTDGRRAGEPFGTNFSASLFADLSDPIGVVRSFTKQDVERTINGGPLTLEFAGGIFNSAENRKKVAELLRYFIHRGGHQLQLNAVDAEAMKAAQKDPERYRQLVVRIWGWSAYFVELDKEFQDHVMARQEYSV